MKVRDFAVHGYGHDTENLPSSPKEASKIGARYFFTGKPCKHGHVSPRYTKGGSCVFCTRINNCKKEGTEFNGIGEKAKKNIVRSFAVKENSVTYIPEHPCKHGHYLRWTGTNNCVECDKISHKQHRDSGRFARIKKLYKMDKMQYLEFVKNHNYSCDICGNKPESHFNLHIDHCHETGRVRGLLCGKCNQGIGLFMHNENIIKEAARYVESF